jgi:hypothetical protein
MPNLAMLMIALDLAGRSEANPGAGLSAAEHDIDPEQHQRKEGDATSDLCTCFVGHSTQPPPVM